MEWAALWDAHLEAQKVYRGQTHTGPLYLASLQIGNGMEGLTVYFAIDFVAIFMHLK